MDSQLISPFCLHLLEGAQPVSSMISDTKCHISAPNKMVAAESETLRGKSKFVMGWREESQLQ